MNTKSLTVANHDLTIKEYKGQRVVTFKDVDFVHERAEGTADRNFRENQQHFIENEDFYKLSKSLNHDIRGLEIPNRGLTVLTESGYLMLVKSFTDDLAWQVQRQLVKTYFRAKEQIKTSANPDRLMIQDKNSRSRMANAYLKIANNSVLPESYRQIMLAYASKELSGQEILPLPKSVQKTYSATEIGDMFGISSQKIGRLTNQHNLKTDEYGEWYHDKSPYSAKEIDSFRYYDSVIPKLKQLL